MPVNADKPHRWKADVAQAGQWHNEWMVRHAPAVYAAERLRVADQIERALEATAHLTGVTAAALRSHPEMLALLRMTATPPLSRERLSALTGAPLALLAEMERAALVPPHLLEDVVEADLQRVGTVLMRLADREIFPWLDNGFHLTGSQIRRAAMIVADRLCIADADALLRTAQKQRQVTMLTRWLEARGCRRNEPPRRLGLEPMSPGTYALDLTVPVLATEDVAKGLIPIDVALMPMSAAPHALPILVEVRSLTGATATPKRRAADATRATALRSTYGPSLCLLLVLCGYLDSGYLGALAAEGIDWAWEHRIDDLAELGLGRVAHDERTPAPRSGLLVAAAPTA